MPVPYTITHPRCFSCPLCHNKRPGCAVSHQSQCQSPATPAGQSPKYHAAPVNYKKAVPHSSAMPLAAAATIVYIVTTMSAGQSQKCRCSPCNVPNCQQVPAAVVHAWLWTRPADTRSPTCPTATAAAEPPDEPPAVLLVSHGVYVVPNTSLYVCEPVPNSGVLVLPVANTKDTNM